MAIKLVRFIKFPIMVLPFNADVMELVDIGDSKSPASNSVAVRVRPSVPYTSQYMNLTTKSIILDTAISALITLLGNGSFYSFLFLFVVMFLPVILIFVSFEESPFKAQKKDKD